MIKITLISSLYSLYQQSKAFLCDFLNVQLKTDPHINLGSKHVPDFHDKNPEPLEHIQIDFI